MSIHISRATRLVAAVCGPLRVAMLLVAFLVAWSWLAQQHAALWRQLPVSAVERYVPDQVALALPEPLPWYRLQDLCAQRASAWQRLLPAGERRWLAACLADPALWVQAEDGSRLAGDFESELTAQMQVARDWLRAWDSQAPGHRAGLQAVLQELRSRPGGALQPLVDVSERWRPPAHADTPRAPIDRLTSAAAATEVRRAMERAQAQIDSAAKEAGTARAVALGMAATGLQLLKDYGYVPPRAALVRDRTSLTATLERRHRGQRLAEQAGGLEALAALHSVPAGIMAAGALLVLVGGLLAAVRRVPFVLVLTCAVVSLLLGLGALLLTDLALTGDPALRHLATRQFIAFNWGDLAVPLLWHPVAGVPVFWPLLAVALGLGLCYATRSGQEPWLAPVCAWVQASAEPRRTVWPAAALLLVAALSLSVPGMSAAASETLLAVGGLGLATYAARQSALASAGGGLQGYNLGIVAVAAAAAVGGSLLRVDLGHALVALGMLVVFAALFSGCALRAALVLGTLLAMALVMVSWWAGAWQGPIAWMAAEVLPPHAQQRMLATFDPFHVDASDLARIRWLMGSAGNAGWGPGLVPWLGLDPARSGDSLPLQGASDYVPALLIAMWGQPWGLLWVGGVVSIFVCAAVIGLRTAARPGTPLAIRALAAFGGFGCAGMAMRAVLSVGGVTGTLPLTGVPVALLGYAPVTHAAGLVYLVLALACSGRQSEVAVRGVRMAPRPMPLTAPARRATVWGLGALVAVAVLLAAATGLTLRSAAEPQHVSQQRLQWADAVARALRAASSEAAASSSDTPGLAHCPQGALALQAWNERLSNLGDGPPDATALGTSRPASLVLSAASLLREQPLDAVGGCVLWARGLGRMLQTDFGRIVGDSRTAALGSKPMNSTPLHRRLAALAPSRATGPRRADYVTGNPWWGVPGCVEVPGVSCIDPARWSDAGESDLLPLDPWLETQLVPALRAAARQPTGSAWVSGRSVQAGPRTSITLRPDLQRLAQTIAECFVGDGHEARCDQAVPTHEAWRERYLTRPQRMRAGAVGVVLMDVATGEVVVMAGSVSDCSALQLARDALPDERGVQPPLRDGQDCARLPDRRMAWLAQQHPALWMLPPGSAMKPLAFAAGVDAGLVPSSQDPRWLRVLADSRERLPVQHLALASGRGYLQVLDGAGFSRAPEDLLWGQPSGSGWLHQPMAGAKGLRLSRLKLQEVERIRAEKASGVNVDQRYGRETMLEYLAARQVNDAAVGGADIRLSAWGLAALWRQIALRADGAAQAPYPHLARGPGGAAMQRLDWLSPGAAQRTLAVSSGVTSAALRGTAQGSCRWAFGACPPQGWPGVRGKTGTSDFLAEEGGTEVKPGLQLPAKLFGGLIDGADGRRYAVGAMALRVRQSSTRTLELQSSAAAEAALLMARALTARDGLPAQASSRFGAAH